MEKGGDISLVLTTKFDVKQFIVPTKNVILIILKSHCQIFSLSYDTLRNKIVMYFSYSSDNLIYMINCKRCLKTDTTLPSQYIGQTGCTLREHFGEHRRGMQNSTDESVPIHFNLPHHTLNDVELIPLLKVRNSRDSYRYTMEQHFISAAGTLKNGINRTSDH